MLDALEAPSASTAETRLELTLIFAHGRSPLDQLWSAHEIQNAVAVNPAPLGRGQSEPIRAGGPGFEENLRSFGDMIKRYEIRLQPTMRDFLYTAAGIAVVSPATTFESAARWNIRI